MTHMPTSRRQFLKSAGALTLSFGIPLMDVHSQSAVAQDKPRLAGDLQIHRKLNAWIRIDSATQMVACQREYFIAWRSRLMPSRCTMPMVPA